MFRPLLAAAITFALSALGASTHADAPALPSTEQAITHALNRLTYGPRRGDLERVKREGLEVWLDRQLNPSRIDDTSVAERLSRLSTLELDSQTLARDIHQPARRERQRRQRERSNSPDNPGLSGVSNELIRKDRQILTDLSEAKVLRAVYSERQLEEVLVDFWFNHFNIFAGKGPTRVWVAEFEREAIRPHVLGNFRAMLGAVAASPAMLFYLDNWMNVEPSSVRLRAPETPRVRRATGLNENYARELLELHTLGVDGGYTQQDIVNVARAFTGWGIGRRPPSLAQSQPSFGGTGQVGGGFHFDLRLHDTAEKTVLGHTIKAGGGMDDGRRVLDILAAHPSTARFIAEKLARRFVSDEPPADLVKRAATRFTTTAGDLKETLRTIITSPEFVAADAYGAKVKTPFEFVVSALRATGSDVQVALPVVRELRELGMPLYLCQPPTGYDDTASTWVSSGALVSRMNFALALGSGRLRGITLPIDSTTTLDSVQATLMAGALAGSASTATVDTIKKATTIEQTVALVLGSPDFQKK